VVSLACQATSGKTVKGQLCQGSFTLTFAGHKLGHRFRFRSGKTNRFTVKLPVKVMYAAVSRARSHHQHRLTSKLLISTKQTHARTRLTRGTLTIRV
jgi:hypothetical protein